MIIKSINSKNFEIKFSKETQLANIDSTLNFEIYDFIAKYFSSYKYTDDDLLKYNSVLPEIFNKNGIISRNKYRCVAINSIYDINAYLEFKKDSYLYEYAKMKMETIDIQKDVFDLEVIYNELSNKISKEFETELINIKPITVNHDFILSKNISPFVSKKYSNYDKLELLLKILAEIYYKTSESFIIYLNNVQDYLTENELKVIKENAYKIDGINLMVSSNKPNFFNYNNVEDIHFLYNKNIVFLPHVNILLNKINNNVNENIEVTDVELEKFLLKYSFNLIDKENSITKKDWLINKAILEKEVDFNIEKEKDIVEISVIV